MTGTDPLGLALLVVLAAGLYARDWIRDRWGQTEKEREHAAIRRSYVDGEIDEQEMERRLGVLLDPRNERIREHVERVNGVGPVTSREVALAFDSVDDLRSADRERLLAISGVGPDRVEAIRERFE